MAVLIFSCQLSELKLIEFYNESDAKIIPYRIYWGMCPTVVLSASQARRSRYTPRRNLEREVGVSGL